MYNQKVALGFLFFLCLDLHAVIVLSSSKPTDNYTSGTDGPNTTWFKWVIINFDILAQALVEPAEKGRCVQEKGVSHVLSFL